VGLITNPAATAVIGCAMRVHTKLGPGLLESVYADCLAKELTKDRVTFQRQMRFPINYDGDNLPRVFVADFVVDSTVLVELKSVERILAVHRAQVVSYLRITGLRKGLLINFNVAHLRDGIRR
jgi:GxxExxY protein